jgi:hypothetical protein
LPGAVEPQTRQQTRKLPGVDSNCCIKSSPESNPELVSIDVDIAGEGSTAQFTEIATMAMSEGSNFINLESDASAEATAFDH